MWTTVEDAEAKKQVARVTAALTGEAKWKFGFRWCEVSNGRCKHEFCLENDACSDIANNHNSNPRAASNAYYINKTLRRFE